VYDLTDEPSSVTTIPVGDTHVSLIDATDRDLVSGYRWRPLIGHNGKVYAYTTRRGVTIYLHRLVASTPKGLETDHVNGDGLDNRRSNLRTATCPLNSANSWKPARPDGAAHTSRFKGVSWDKARNKWQSKINTHGTGTRNLGRYLSEEDAAQAYDAAAFAAWGDYARLNFPREGSNDECSAP
jgi:hypothetical protein